MGRSEIPAVPFEVADPGLESDEDDGTPINSSASSFGISLLPYRLWSVCDVPDPREAPLEEIVRVLRDIATVEGPVVAYRALQLFARAASIGRIKEPLRDRFEQALKQAERDGVIQVSLQGEERVLHVPGSPAVLLRERGGRLFQEIPPGELAEAAKRIRESRPVPNGEEMLKAVCEVMGIHRITENIRAKLDKLICAPLI